MPSDKDRFRARFPIAIVGMSCRLPGARDLEEFWTLLRTGGNAVGEIPKGRWDVDYYFHPDPAQTGRSYTRAGGFLDDIEGFDADFFGISPREARQMDPQQRILLELTWEALENADIVPAQLAGSDTGVFIGASSTDYGVLQRSASETVADPYAVSGSAASITANRLSHFFDFQGPSLAIDTACSSALVAVHEACESLWRGEAALTVAGGINLILLPESMVGFSKAAMLSPRGRCAAFDAEADGYVRSEGGGIIILKPLADAVAAGNPIHAVILGSAVNSDGRTKGIALPNPIAQEKLLRQVYATAGIDPAEISYVEAHGTGTMAGDRVECTALGRVFGAARPPGSPCWIGSVKSNIGHLEPASGIAGLLKAVLALKHRALPRTVHFTTPNPKIPFGELNLAVVSELTPLPRTGAPPMAGINSFGFGGTNAHVVLRASDETPAASDRGSDDAVKPLFLSARSSGAIRTLAQSYARLLRSPEAPPLGALCRAAALCRSHHPHRIATFGANPADVASRLEAFAADQPALLLAESEARYQTSRLAFVFSGNGSQWVGMGRDLLAQEPLFAETVAAIDVLLEPLIGRSLLKILGEEQPPDFFDRTEIAQPALFAVQVGIVSLLRARGIDAEAMVGHSVGEVAAAYAAGILSLEEAALVIARRSQAQGRTAGAGKMAAVGLSESQAMEVIAPYGDAVSIAGVNSPNSVTLAGDAEALDELRQTIRGKGAYFRLLGLDYAFHSRAMEPLRAEILQELAALAPRTGRRHFISAVTGAECDGVALDARYWWDNIRRPVQFARAIRTLAADGIDVFLEIGPHPILAGYLRECLQSRATGSTIIGTLRRDESERDALWLAIARCYTAGVEIDYATLFPEKKIPVELPAYPWQRERFWFAKSDRIALPSFGPRAHPLLGYRMPTADIVWRNQLDPVKLAYLADHVVQGATVFPASGYVEMALAAAALRFAAEGAEIEGLEIRRPIVFSGKGGQWIEFDLSPEDNTFRILCQEKPDAAQPPAIVGRLAPLAAEKPLMAAPLAELRARLCRGVSADEHYARCARHGLNYGPAFRGICEMWTGDGEVLARIDAPAALDADAAAYRLHPALLDAALQAILGALPSAGEAADHATYVPTQVERIRFFGGDQPIAWCHGKVLQAGRQAVVARFALLDTTGATIAELEGVRFRRIGAARAEEIPAWHWQARLQPSLFWVGSSGDLPGPLKLAADLRGEIAALRRHPAIDAFQRHVAPALDRLAAAYAQRALRRLGIGEEPCSLDALAERGRVLPDRLGLLEALLPLAERHGLVARRGDVWAMVEWPSAKAPEALWRDLLAEHPDCLASLDIVARWGEHLPALLRGEADPGELFFPERDFSAAEQLFDFDPASRIGNEIVASIMRHLRDATPADRALRILEIGGATGALTSAVLPALPAERVEYVFTDAQEEAVARAQGKFLKFPFLRCAAFDIERDLASQGFEAAPYDVILAAYALGDIAAPGEALERLRLLLKPGGLLIMVEPISGGFLDLVFACRRRSSIAANESASSGDWLEHLKRAGFAEATTIGEDKASSGAAVSAIVARTAPTNGHAPMKAARERRQWIVLTGGSSDTKDGIASRLREAGQGVITVLDGESFDRLDSDLLRAPLADADDHRQLVAALRASLPSEIDIVYARGLARRVNGAALDPMAAQERGSIGLMLLVQAFAEAGLTANLRLWVITRGAMATPHRPAVTDPAQAPLWGAARTLMNERPDLTIRLIDLDPAEGDGVSDLFLSELLHPTDEDELILRGRTRHVHRLHRGMPGAAAQVADATRPIPYRLAYRAGEGHDGLAIDPMAMPEAGAGEVIVRVRAAGLNYRDVLQRVGILPEEAFEGGFAGATLGMEFAGEVIAVSPEVNSLSRGDGVFGFAPGAFSSHLKVPASMLFRKPPTIGFAAAATMPVAMLTAYYSLCHVARLQAGERVLIHGAAGGVGLAAIQYAQSVGAEIFASAGTPAKREFLRRLGVHHVVDSRSLGFADEIRQLTGGEGVDVVLNSLAGEALHKGVMLLRPYGRFIELGKRDFWANTKLGLQPFRNNIQFCGVDVDRLLVDRPALAQKLFREMEKLIADGVARPLPHRAFPVARAGEAFRHMQQSRHIGKVVLDFAEDIALPRPVAAAQLSLAAEATYLVTGGRGGFGLATAEWLAAKGARHLALIGRSRDTAADAASALQSLRDRGVEVREGAVDVADQEQLARFLAEIRRDMPPLRGVVHCAAVIDDATITTLSAERFRAVLRPKVAGAANLDRLTRDLPLDFFILYSSAITLFGNPGQSNYAAANLYLEALTEQRRAEGLPALVVLWGAIGGVGHLARHAETVKTMTERLGIKLLAPADALARLEQAIIADAGQVAIADLNWPRLTLAPQLAKSPKYALVRPNPEDAATENDRDAEALTERLAAMPEAQRYPYVQQLVIGHLASVLRMPAGRLNIDQSLLDLGMDSLMVVELQLAMEQQFGITISPLELMDVATVAQLIKKVAEKLGVEPIGTVPEGGMPVDAIDIDTLPPEMLDDVLGKLLGGDADGTAIERVT